jgi:NAD/NADP transhydrogenase beta subunit
MNANLAALLYLVSGILFILALRGLSSFWVSPSAAASAHGARAPCR